MSLIITIVNGMLNLVGTAIISTSSLLPDSPFQWNLSGASTLLTWLFWLVPIPGILTLLSAYVAAVALYYAIRVVLRWLKVVGT
jgi:hypothetical protein